MNQEIFESILDNDQISSTSPDAVKHHWTQPDYIRCLTTRARVLHGDMSREDVVKKCGVSLSSLNKYITTSSRHVPCPYSVQFLLERLAKLKSSERASVFKLEMTVPEADVGFFSRFDSFMSSNMMGGISRVVVMTTVLTTGEVCRLREKGVKVSAEFAGD